MTSRSDEIEKSMDTVVSESRITFNPGLFGENVIVLPLKIPNNLREALSD